MVTLAGTKAHSGWSVSHVIIHLAGREQNSVDSTHPLARKAASIMAEQAAQRATPSMCLRQLVLPVIKTAILVMAVEAVKMVAEAEVKFRQQNQAHVQKRRGLFN